MGHCQIDSNGYRANVGLVLANDKGQVLWARRVGRNGWQFPQGGIHEGESPTDALFRELAEEVGLSKGDVEVVASTSGWLRYRVPHSKVLSGNRPQIAGQKQKWFLLRLRSAESHIRLNATDAPEFDQWRWVSYWYPLGRVVFFKREVYRHALKQLAPELSWVC